MQAGHSVYIYPVPHHASSVTSSRAGAALQDQLLAAVTAVARGDTSALTEVYELTSGQLLAISRAILTSNEDAKEVVVDVFCWLWQNAARYASERGQVLAWLAVITRRRAIDRLRKRRLTLSLDALGAEVLPGALRDETGPDRWLAAFQTGTAVHEALRHLTPLRQRLIGLSFFQGLSHEEIATLEALPLGSVKSHLRRALLRMRQSLDHLAAAQSGGGRPRMAEFHHAIIDDALL